MDTTAKVEEIVYKHQCTQCIRGFHTLRGLNQHLRTCSKSMPKKHRKPPDPPDKDDSPDKDVCSMRKEQLLYKWGDFDDKTFEKNVQHAYDVIVYWRKNLFLLPTGKFGKSYIDENTRLMNAWVEDSPLKNIAFKAIMIMPSLLLQKPFKNSK